MALSTVTGLIGGGKAREQSNIAALNGQRQQDLSATSQYEQNIAENKAIADSNLENVIRTGYKVGLLNVQRAQAKKMAMQQGVDLSRRGLQLTATATANAAASGTIGSSVNAVVLDIAMRQDEAGAQMGSDYAMQEANFDVALHDLITNGGDSMTSAQRITVQDTAKAQLTSGRDVVLGVAANVALKAASSYLGGQMNLGSKSKGVDDYAISRAPSISTTTADDLGQLSIPSTVGSSLTSI